MKYAETVNYTIIGRKPKGGKIIQLLALIVLLMR